MLITAIRKEHSSANCLFHWQQMLGATQILATDHCLDLAPTSPQSNPTDLKQDIPSLQNYRWH